MRREILVLYGRVQAVGFRERVLEIARRFPVSGTVRNLRDGGLEIDVEGEDDAIQRFRTTVLMNAPRLARVDHSTRSDAEPRGVIGFSVGPTR